MLHNNDNHFNSLTEFSSIILENKSKMISDFCLFSFVGRTGVDRERLMHFRSEIQLRFTTLMYYCCLEQKE